MDHNLQINHNISTIKVKLACSLEGKCMFGQEKLDHQAKYKILFFSDSNQLNTCCQLECTILLLWCITLAVM